MNLFKTTAILLTLSSALISQESSAHSRWILPSHVTLSGEKAHHVALDISISNELFKADKALKPRKKGEKKAKGRGFPSYLTLTHPDGTIETDLPFTAFTRKSVADFKLAEAGTYKASLYQPGIVFTIYKKSDGSRGRAFGPKNKVKLPEGAKLMKSMAMVPVAETYISRNGQTEVQTSGSGLEWNFKTHPNELFAGEVATFKLLIDGQPAKNTKVDVVKGGTRYRNERGGQTFTTDKNGEVNITWQGAGMYMIETGYDVPSKQKHIDVKHYALFTTLEVNPD